MRKSCGGNSREFGLWGDPKSVEGVQSNVYSLTKVESYSDEELAAPQPHQLTRETGEEGGYQFDIGPWGETTPPTAV